MNIPCCSADGPRRVATLALLSLSLFHAAPLAAGSPGAGASPLAGQPFAGAPTVAVTARAGARVEAAGRGTPWINLTDGVSLEATFTGEAQFARAAAYATPRALASADFDEDGMPDLAAAHETDEGGLVVLHRGNVDALYPNSPEARRHKAAGFADQPFLIDVSVAPLPSAPDLLAAGDFDADGHWDLVAARRGANRLELLAGDGRGGFAAARQIALPGVVTALAAGEIDRADGLTDLAVGVRTDEEARILVFEGPDGALRLAPESFPIPAEASDLVMGQFDGGYAMDLAATAGSHLVVVRGRDRKLSFDASLQPAVEPARVSIEDFSVALRSVVAGNFTGDGRETLAVLGEDGAVRLLGRAAAKGTGREVSGERWPGATRLVRAKVSSGAGDDLVVMDPAGGLRIVSGAGADVAAKRPVSSVTLDTEAEVVAVLPMRLNGDAFSDLVLLGSGTSAPSYLLTQPNTIFTVTTTANDSSPGSLGAAIAAANGNLGADQINFNIPGAGPHTIDRIIAYSITEVTIDGTTEPDYAGAPVVVLDGPMGGLGSGFSMQANSVIRGMSIVNFQGGAGIFLGFDNGGHATGNVVENNYLGLLPNGTALGDNNAVLIQASANNNLIGGTVAAARNYISGNVGTGVVIAESANNNTVRGNYIGTNITGTAAIPNVQGVQASSTPNNVIGGTTAGARNLISGNGNGINIQATILVQGNYIGTDVTGTLDLGNSNYGIGMNNAVFNATIGGTTPAARNIVAGNNADGIDIDGSNNMVQGNYIGVNVNGSALGNGIHGVNMIGRGDGTAHVLGGTAAGAGNVISGNGQYGVLHGAAPSGTLPSLIQGNLIGTDPTGTSAVPNGLDGVRIGIGTLGGSAPGARNVISGNTTGGISGSNASGITIQGNFIGTQIDGVSPLGNGGPGIIWGGNVNTITMGGTAPGAGNTIAFNSGDGIIIFGFANNLMTIRGNSIFSNTGLGIDVENDGVSPNDNCDGDFRTTNYPVLTSATSSGGSTTIMGSLNSNASSTFSLDFFASSSCDPSGSGEGQTYIGSAMVTTNASCVATINVVLPVSVPTGQLITATTTDSLGNTGEHSACIQVNDTAPNGRDTVAIYSPSTGAWFERNSNSSGVADVVFGYGPAGAGWIPLRGDWNGDGVDSPGLYNPANGFFFLRNSNAPGPADLTFGFGPGGSGFTPVIGDFNGDGVDTIGLYVPANGFFFLKNTNTAGNADLVFGYGPGGQGFIPVVGDYDGNRTDTVGIYNPATGFFFLKNTNAAGNADLVFGFGAGGQGFVPLFGDYDGDGDDTVGFYVPSNGFFFLKNTNAAGNADLVFGYGPAGATPLLGDWNGQ